MVSHLRYLSYILRHKWHVLRADTRALVERLLVEAKILRLIR